MISQTPNFKQGDLTAGKNHCPWWYLSADCPGVIWKGSLTYIDTTDAYEKSGRTQRCFWYDAETPNNNLTWAVEPFVQLVCSRHRDIKVDDFEVAAWSTCVHTTRSNLGALAGIFHWDDPPVSVACTRIRFQTNGTNHCCIMQETKSNTLHPVVKSSNLFPLDSNDTYIFQSIEARPQLAVDQSTCW